MLIHLRVGTKHTGREFREALKQEQDKEDVYMAVVHVNKCPGWDDGDLPPTADPNPHRQIWHSPS
jgi:hypothetical protein